MNSRLKQLLEDPKEAFPGLGNLKAWDAEHRKLQRELSDVKEERDILKKPWPFSRRNVDERLI